MCGFQVEQVREFAEPKLTPRRIPDKDLEDDYEDKAPSFGVTTPQQVTPQLRTDKVGGLPERGPVCGGV